MRVVRLDDELRELSHLQLLKVTLFGAEKLAVYGAQVCRALGRGRERKGVVVASGPSKGLMAWLPPRCASCVQTACAQAL